MFDRPDALLILICTNLIPIGTYLCVLGVLHAMGRPLVTTAGRDFLALALALSGLAVNGPLGYLMTSRMLPDLLVENWWMALVVYAVIVASLMPRRFRTLVVYNCPEQGVCEAVQGILEQHGLDPQRVCGGWMLANRGVTLEVEPFLALNNVTLHFRGVRDLVLFEQIRDGLIECLRPIRTGWSATGVIMAAAGWLTLSLPIWLFARDPGTIATILREFMGAN